MKQLSRLSLPLLFFTACTSADLETATGDGALAPASYNARLIGSSGLPAVVAPGSTYVLNVQLQNTGTSPIVRGIERFTSLNTPVRLWGFQNVSMPRATINPGELFTIPVPIVAPLTPNTYRLMATMIHTDANRDLIGYFGDVLDLTIVVDANAGMTNDAEVVSTNFGNPSIQGEPVTFSVTMRNTGTATWSGSNYSLVDTTGQLWGIRTLSLPAGASVAPGQQITFTANGNAPAEEGYYPIQFSMRYSVVLFGDTAQPASGVRIGCPAALEASVVATDPDIVFADYLANDVLNRSFTPIERATYVELLATGGSRADLALQLLDSAEHRTVMISDAYELYLERSPTTAEIGSMLALDTLNVHATILGSNEYRGMSGTTNRNFLSHLFVQVLERSITLAERTAYEQQLIAGTPRSVVAAEVLSSVERYTLVVERQYASLLDRTPFQEELDMYVGALVAGNTDEEEVAATLLASEEYGWTLAEVSVDSGSSAPFQLFQVTSSDPDVAGVVFSGEINRSDNSSSPVQVSNLQTTTIVSDSHSFATRGAHQAQMTLFDGNCPQVNIYTTVWAR